MKAGEISFTTPQYSGHPHQNLGHITYSQNGEDLFLLNLFRLIGIEKPSYLDLGAYHPINISNTALFYSLGCRGVNIEANPILMPAFDKERPEDTNINVAIATTMGELTMYLGHDRGGATNSLDIDEFYRHNKVVEEKIKVSAVTLGFAVENYCGGKYPDLLLTDIEGLDSDVLCGADFTYDQPKIICAEIRREESKKVIGKLFLDGYAPLIRIGSNFLFIGGEYAGKVNK